LSVGILGVNVVGPVLSDVGRTDLAYALLHQDALPSWMYSVENGASTVWERWNSRSAEDGLGPVNMNSFNRYAYGAIIERMYEHMAGIANDPVHPGHLRRSGPGGGAALDDTDGVSFVGFENGVATLELASGSYEVTSTLPWGTSVRGLKESLVSYSPAVSSARSADRMLAMP
jgi:hypothetical protein